MVFTDMYLTRRQFIALAATVAAGSLVIGETREAASRDQVVRYDGWILRLSDIQTIESEHA